MTDLERRALLRCLGMERPCAEYSAAKLIRKAMNETGEYIDRQKLIDDFRTEGACFVYGDCVPGIISRIRAQPVIDPETLPIVRQLREELARVTAERDAAIKDIEAAMASENTQNILDYLCSLCQNMDLNRGCTCDGKCLPKWRGAQKEE